MVSRKEGDRENRFSKGPVFVTLTVMGVTVANSSERRETRDRLPRYIQFSFSVQSRCQ